MIIQQIADLQAYDWAFILTIIGLTAQLLIAHWAFIVWAAGYLYLAAVAVWLLWHAIEATLAHPGYAAFVLLGIVLAGRWISNFINDVERSL